MEADIAAKAIFEAWPPSRSVVPSRGVVAVARRSCRGRRREAYIDISCCLWFMCVPLLLLKFAVAKRV